MIRQNFNYSEINFIEFYGIRRGGNHAILGWLMHNLSSSPGNIGQLIAPFPEFGYISQSCGDVCQINDAGSVWSVKNPAYVRGLIDAYISMGFKTIIVSYEDCSHTASLLNIDREAYFMLENAKKITVNRNLKNILASRWKASQTPMRIAFEVTESVVSAWCKNLEFEGTKIIYENWLTSKEYRDAISEELGCPNLDHTNHVSNAGGGSSFSGIAPVNKDRLLTRSQEVELPEDWAAHLEDPRVKELLHKYWPSF